MQSTVLKLKSNSISKFKVFLSDSLESLNAHPTYGQFLSEIKPQLGYKQKKALLHIEGNWHLIQVLDEKDASLNLAELARRKSSDLVESLNQFQLDSVEVHGNLGGNICLAFAEGLAMANYQFLKYSSKAEKKKNSLKTIYLEGVQEEGIQWVNAKLQGNFMARDLVNEPLNTLTATELSNRAAALASEDMKVQVFGKKEIQEMGMGGLLAVNLGSEDPPSFTIMHYKPKNAKNKKPIALVGKGVVFDTGGLSLKPTANSMDMMKSDMGGAAAVIGTMKSIQAAKLPVEVIGLVPATDNRPGKNAYVPSDIITMYDGTKVEVLNTDAEGRMILADALAYAKKFEPELCINLATLTGAAAYSIGKVACVSMGNAQEGVWKILDEASTLSGERHARFPFWKEYQEMIQSDIADIKNIGGPEGGAITAGKFLEHFTDCPFIHLDIAGPAYLTDNYLYHPKGGSGFGVRLLSEFLKTMNYG